MARRLPTVQVSLAPHVRSLEDIGGAVRNARAVGQMRIDDAAAFAGVSVDLLSRLENGKPVTTDRLLKVLDALGLEMAILQRGQVLQLRDLLKEELP